MGIVTPLDHISPTQIEMYRRCPMQFYYRYVLGMKVPPNSNLTRGRCVHKGAEFNYRQKVDSKKDLAITEVKEFVAATFEEESVETQWVKDEKPGQVKDLTISLSTLYHREFAPKIQPLSVEQEISLPLEGYGFDFLGYIDLITESLWIRDLKSSMRSPAKDEIDKSLQLSAYAWGFHRLTQKLPKGVALDYAVGTKTPQMVSLEGTRNENDIARFVKTVGKVAYAIQQGCYFPNEHNFLCSPEKCGYWKQCHKDW